MEEIKVNYNPHKINVELDKREFALALKTWRLRRGLTQQQVGEMFGCSRYTIMRAEAAKNITWEQAYRMFAKLSYQLERESKS